MQQTDLEKITRKFFEHKIIEINIKNPFKLSSGKTSPIYIDHRKIFSHPELRHKIIEHCGVYLSEKFNELNIPPEQIVFAGTATAGIAPAYALSEYFGCGFVYVRSKAKEHGTSSLIEGNIPSHCWVVVVDDMVTTGGSLMKASDIIHHSNIPVLCCFSISSNNMFQTKSIFLEKNLKYFCLLQTPELFEMAVHLKLITKEENNYLQQWLSPN